MSIRDIIEAYDAHRWYSANAFASPAVGRFIATFDPDHVALYGGRVRGSRSRPPGVRFAQYSEYAAVGRVLCLRRARPPHRLPEGAWTVTTIPELEKLLDDGLVFIRVPAQMLDSRDQDADIIQTRRDGILINSIGGERPRIRTAYNTEHPQAHVLTDDTIRALVDVAKAAMATVDYVERKVADFDQGYARAFREARATDWSNTSMTLALAPLDAMRQVLAPLFPKEADDE